MFETNYLTWCEIDSDSLIVKLGHLNRLWIEIEEKVWMSIKLRYQDKWWFQELNYLFREN